ncbi:MAG TPA: MBL fold metallo-hydrolase [Chthoniobacteraceae bacterium]|jgi:L-ascorbate metabolism protein UlaG (beta-lactamase superfamily)|nr:MBL fold metallo-hydrolase [Chthoniobacteraceae bacterium]
MIQPFLRDDAFLASVAEGRAAGDEAVRLWWLGQSGFLVHYQRSTLLLDPYLSDSLTRKYAGTDKPHVRMTERVIAPERLESINIITSSHGHTDHLDADTLRPLLQANPHSWIVFPAPIRELVNERMGGPRPMSFGLRIGESMKAGAFHVTAVPAAHEELAPEYVGYIIRVGPHVIYHSGDTLRFPHQAESLRTFGIDIALLPINGRAPERRVAGNLDGPEAAQLAHDLRARLVIPCHYEMFEFNTASPAPFVAECERLGQPYRVLRAGEGCRFPAP